MAVLAQHGEILKLPISFTFYQYMIWYSNRYESLATEFFFDSLVTYGNEAIKERMKDERFLLHPFLSVY